MPASAETSSTPPEKPAEKPGSQQFAFQAEVKQLLHLLAHSLYQSREIGVRELVSNASDALDKMRHLALVDPDHRDDAPLEVTLQGGEENHELAIVDNGIGMTHDELVTNLGTIAHSGSLDFLKRLGKNEQADISLIGQFGVGFYSAFMLADRVTVRTRSYSDSAGWQWESDGTGSFTITPVADLPRGTRVILHLRDDACDFAKSLRLKTVLQKYSSFVPHPIRLDDEVINRQKAIWVEPAAQIDADQYDHFYQHLTHQENEKPLWHLHLSVDSPIQFHALLYCPPTNFELLGLGRLEHGLNLCVKRVLVQNDCRELVPEFFRFLRGVVDSEDLPLNISRDALQDNTIFQKIRGTLVRSVLDSLQKMSEKEPEKYQTFYGQYARMLKEGAHADFVHRERTVRLLRYASTTAEDPEKPTSLDQYVERCGEQQKQVYYLGGASLQSVAGNPNLEIFRKRGLEVLFLLDPIDEFVLSTLGTYKEHQLVSIDSADLELPETAAEDDDSGEKTPDKEKQETPAGEGVDGGFEKVLELFRETLDEKAADVRQSKRLTDSPCCLVAASAGMSTHMQGLLERVDSDFVAAKPVLEVNPAAPLVVRLSQLASDAAQHEFIRACGQQLFANAQLLEGIVPEPQEMATRMQQFMEQAAGQK